jgi:tetratricopeptide (TPR) repeat protein
MNRILLILTFLGLFIVSACSSKQQEKQEPTDSSNQLLNNQLEQQLQDSTLSDSMRVQLIEKLAGQEQFAPVLQQLELLLKKEPNNPGWLYMKADALEKTADTTGAIATYTAAIVAAGLFNEAELRLANLYAETGNAETLKICDALLRQPSAVSLRSPVLLVKAIYFIKSKKSEQAITVLNQLIREDYTYMDAYIEKGLIYYDAANFAEAFRVFEKSTQVKNSFAEGYFWMAKSQEKLKKEKEAIANYKRSLALDQSLTEARTALQRLGEIKE